MNVQDFARRQVMRWINGDASLSCQKGIAFTAGTKDHSRVSFMSRGVWVYVHRATLAALWLITCDHLYGAGLHMSAGNLNALTVDALRSGADQPAGSGRYFRHLN